MKIYEAFPGIPLVKKENQIGVEIEMEGEGIHNLEPNYWSVGHDGSLRGQEAIEYTLKSPSTVPTIDKKLSHLYNKFDNNSRIFPSDRCGVHIHINCQHLELSQVFNFITLYLIFEDLIVAWCGEDREGNLFCLRAQDAEWLLYCLISDKMKGYFHTSVERNRFKYASINVAALSYYGSLEFRALRTPDNKKPILDFITLLLRLKAVACSVPDPVKFITSFSERGEVGWAKDVLGDSFDMLNRPNMGALLTNGVRMTQALAYTPFVNIEAPKIHHEEEVEIAVDNDDEIREMIRQQHQQRGIRWADVARPVKPVKVLKKKKKAPRKLEVDAGDAHNMEQMYRRMVKRLENGD
jgi:hypothetical protein